MERGGTKPLPIQAPPPMMKLQKNNHTTTIIISLVIVAFIVVGGLFYFKKLNSDSKKIIGKYNETTIIKQFSTSILRINLFFFNFIK
jgi:hypothetical protein